MASSKGNWTVLRPGDCIDVIAPGFSFNKTLIKKVHTYIERLGYRANIPKDILGKDLICSQSKEVRFEHLKKAIQNKDSKMIWALRGGYGSIQLLPYLAKLKAPQQAKLFWGFSDVTSLHLFLNQQWGWKTVHGQSLERLSQTGFTSSENRQVQKILSGSERDLLFKSLKPLNEAAKKDRLIKAPIVGGNLAVLSSSAGSPWSLKSSGKILFLEEVSERAYRVDRMLVQLEQSGALKSVKAILLGNFIGGSDKDGVSRVWPLLKRYASEKKIPVLSGLKVGHGTTQKPLVFQSMAHLQTGSKARLNCNTGSMV